MSPFASGRITFRRRPSHIWASADRISDWRGSCIRPRAAAMSIHWSVSKRNIWCILMYSPTLAACRKHVHSSRSLTLSNRGLFARLFASCIVSKSLRSINNCLLNFCTTDIMCFSAFAAASTRASSAPCIDWIITSLIKYQQLLNPSWSYVLGHHR